MAKWVSVAGYEGYYNVSDQGTIRSVARVIIRGRGIHQPIRSREMRLHINIKSGYLQVKLCRDGETVTFYVHRLVALAFCPNPDEMPEVNHKDTNKQNNRSENLEWVTSAGNKQHAITNGIFSYPPVKCGEEHPRALLTWDEVNSIRRDYRPRVITQIILAKRFGVSECLIGRILANQLWVVSEK